MNYFYILFYIGLLFVIIYVYKKISYICRVESKIFEEVEAEILTIESNNLSTSSSNAKLRYYINGKKYVVNSFNLKNIKVCDVRAGQKVWLLYEKDNPNKLYELDYLKNNSELYLIIGLLVELLGIFSI